MSAEPPRIQNVAVLGGHIPRQCGIATFTSDLRLALAREYPKAACRVVAMTDGGSNYEYPDCVCYEIAQDDQTGYRQAADFLNLRGAEVLSLQHEYGIFGGKSGAYILDLLRRVNMPVVTTLHTVLQEPTREQRHVMHEMNRLCDRFVVMADHGKEMLEDVYGVSGDKVDVVPHGVIDVPFLDPEFNKERFGVLGNTVLLTFGLLSPNKGIEQAIRALPGIVERHPDVVYVVAGVTHPHLRAHDGEAYREMLQSLAVELGVENHLKFENRFMDLAELTAMIEAADIYITPYLNEAQITSGALSYAFGAGKAIVSTPYWHAQELLAGNRGTLVPFSDPDAIEQAVNQYLEQPCLMTAVRKRAYEAGRSMTWPHTARGYMQSFERARQQRSTRVDHKKRQRPAAIPEPNFNHLITMTSHLGMFQHAVHDVPNNSEGCCLDDNARAYLLAVLVEGLDSKGVGQAAFSALAGTYLAFMWDAFDPVTRKFRNFMSRGLEWMELEGSEDSHARALWAVGVGVSRTSEVGHRGVCAMLFQRGFPQLGMMKSPRAWAFGLLGVNAYLTMCPGDREALAIRKKLTGQLMRLYDDQSSDDWNWFEPVVSYDNARVPQAMIQSGMSMGDDEVLSVGLEMLEWLVGHQTADGGWFSPIGCHGFWRRGDERARFDQQPLEAGAMVAACLQAAEATSDPVWEERAAMCAAWFTGYNDLGLDLYDRLSGGCHDALRADHWNENQGAESTIACQMAIVEMMLAKQKAKHKEELCTV